MPDSQLTPSTNPISGVIVAGGQSRRLGVDKRRLHLWGETGPTLLEHTVNVLAPLCAEVIVVLNDPDEWGSLPAQLVTDLVDGGALGGLYSGLAAASYPFALLVAADMPFLNVQLLQSMLDYPRSYDALVPRTADQTRNRLNAQTLHAIYGRNNLDLLRKLLDQGVRRIADYLTAVHTTFIEPETVATYDPRGLSFVNINTPDDMERLQKIIQTP